MLTFLLNIGIAAFSGFIPLYVCGLVFGSEKWAARVTPVWIVVAISLVVLDYIGIHPLPSVLRPTPSATAYAPPEFKTECICHPSSESMPDTEQLQDVSPTTLPNENVITEEEINKNLYNAFEK